MESKHILLNQIYVLLFCLAPLVLMVEASLSYRPTFKINVYVCQRNRHLRTDEVTSDPTVVNVILYRI